jgi:hypothetical protein
MAFVPSQFSMEDLVQRSQIQIGNTITEVFWDTKNRQVVVLGKGVVVSDCMPYNITLLDVLEALDITRESVVVDGSSIAMSDEDIYTMYEEGKISLDELPMWSSIRNRTDEVLTLPLEVEVYSTMVVTV